MAQAKRDQNSVTTLLGVSNADGITPVIVYADPTTHRLLVDVSGGGAGTVTGSGTATYISYWSSSSNITGDSGFTFSGTTKQLSIGTTSTHGSLVFYNTGGSSSYIGASEDDTGSGSGLDISINSGSGGTVSGRGGSISITAGGAQAGNNVGGNVIITAGTASGSGDNGYIQIVNTDSNEIGVYSDVDGGVLIKSLGNNYAGLDTSSLSQFRSYKFPNLTGTLSLTGAPYLVVASSTAPDKVRAAADYVCDGTADDVQIQAALDALPSAGGTVHLTEGTFIIATSININKSSITFEGSGWSTVVKAKVGLNDHVIKFDNTNFIASCIFRSFKLDGDLLDQSSGNGIDALGATTCIFDSIWFTAIKDYCLHFNGRADNSFGSNNFITNCQFTNGAKRGIYIQRCDENKINGNLFTEISGYHIYDNSGSSVVSNNIFVGGAGFTTGIGVYVLNTSSTVISNNMFDALNDEFIYLDNSDDCIIVGNRMSKVAGGTTKAIMLLDSADSTVISSNRVEGGTKYPYVVKEQNSSTNTFIGINSFDPGNFGTLLVPSPATSYISPITVTTSGTASIAAINLINTATSGTSYSVIYTEVDSGSTGDPFIQFSVNGVTDWAMGVDNSDSDKFKISASTNLGDTDILTIGTDGSLGGYITSGTYLPTSTLVANLDTGTLSQCQYMRVGKVVTVSGRADLDPTAPAATTQFGISLPIASNFGATSDCAGTAFASGIAAQGAAIRADATNDRAEMIWKSSDITNQPMYFTFTYEII